MDSPAPGSRLDTVGVVGLGRMGGRMARRLLAAGWEVVGVDRSAEARERVEALGVNAGSELSALAEVGVVMTSLPDTSEVETVYLGKSGLFELLSPGSLCVDLSTISVEASRRVAAEAAMARIDFLDAPVSGTSLHAEEGTLAVMAGGNETAFARAVPYFRAFARSFHYLGGPGAGLTVKLISNRLLTSVLVALAESIGEIEAADLQMEVALEALRAGAVPRLLDYKAGPMAQRDFTPRFTVDLMAKDLGLAADLFPPGALATVSEAILLEAQAAGYGAADIGAAIEVVTSPGLGTR